MADFEYEIDSTTTSTNSVDIIGLDDIDVDLDADLSFNSDSEARLTTVSELKPIEADLGTRSELKIDPLKTQSDLTLDLKPAVVDLCLTLNVGKVPSMCIRQPYRHNLGFTWMGIELWNFSFSGEQETIVQEMPPKPQVAWGGQKAAWAPGSGASRDARSSPEPPSRTAGGLRVRLGP